MKERTESILIGVVFFALMVGGIGSYACFGTVDCRVALINPTEEQILELYKSNSETDRFWVREAHAVKGENSIVETTLGVRATDGGETRVREVLEELGLEYYIISTE